MNRQEIINRLLDHYEHPRNREVLTDADVVQPGGQPECSDTLTLYLAVAHDHETVERLTFEGQGCTVSQAAASILSEFVPGKTLSALEQFEHQEMIDMLGREVVATRVRCATLALNTLKQAIQTYRRTHRNEATPL
jgi:nitrogen fixation NifU-like protein